MSAEDREVRKVGNQGDRTGGSYFDDLARGLAEGTISRRQALKWIGAGAVAFAIMPVAPKKAEALTRRRCLRRDGIPLDRGDCDCAFDCGAEFSRFNCQSDPDCYCLETVTGRGFCGFISNKDCRVFHNCRDNSDCASGYRCIVNSCCDSRICVPSCSMGAAALSASSASTESTGSGPTPLSR